MRNDTMAQSDATRGDAIQIQTMGDFRQYARASPGPWHLCVYVDHASLGEPNWVSE